MFGMRRLLQIAASTWLKQYDKLESWTEKAVGFLSESFPDAMIHYDSLVFAALLPHAEIVLEYRYFHEIPALKQAELSLSAAKYLMTLGNYDVAMKRTQQALSIHDHFLSEENPLVLDNATFYGIVLFR